MPERYPHRRINSLRLKGFDYSTCGAYHIVIRTNDRAPLLGVVEHNNIAPTASGEAVLKAWNELPEHYSGVLVDASAAMPNHFHGLVMLIDPIASNRSAEPRTLGLPQLMQRFKSWTTREHRLLTGLGHLWERSYWDEIINSERQFYTVRDYILNNALADYLKLQNKARAEAGLRPF